MTDSNFGSSLIRIMVDSNMDIVNSVALLPGETRETSRDSRTPVKTTGDPKRPANTSGDSLRQVETKGDQQRPAETSADQRRPVRLVEARAVCHGCTHSYYCLLYVVSDIAALPIIFIFG